MTFPESISFCVIGGLSRSHKASSVTRRSSTDGATGVSGLGMIIRFVGFFQLWRHLQGVPTQNFDEKRWGCAGSFLVWVHFKSADADRVNAKQTRGLPHGEARLQASLFEFSHHTALVVVSRMRLSSVICQVLSFQLDFIAGVEATIEDLLCATW